MELFLACIIIFALLPVKSKSTLGKVKSWAWKNTKKRLKWIASAPYKLFNWLFKSVNDTWVRNLAVYGCTILVWVVVAIPVVNYIFTP